MIPYRQQVVAAVVDGGIGAGECRGEKIPGIVSIVDKADRSASIAQGDAPGNPNRSGKLTRIVVRPLRVVPGSYSVI